MGTLTIQKFEKHSIGDVFIETGSQEGWTLALAQQFGFKRIVGIELNQAPYNFSIKKFGHLKNVEIILGESPDILAELCPTLIEPATFWLDAHASGAPESGLFGGKYGACPLIQELRSINLSPCKSHTLLIDDVRLFGTHEWEFLNKQDVIDEIFKINTNYRISYIDGEDDGSFLNDIMVVKI